MHQCLYLSLIHIFSLQLQQKIQEALIKAGLTDLEVKTDYDTYIKHIDENQQFWEMLIEQSPKLSAVTPNVDKLRKELSDLEPKTCLLYTSRSGHYIKVVYQYIPTKFRNFGKSSRAA